MWVTYFYFIFIKVNFRNTRQPFVVSTLHLSGGQDYLLNTSSLSLILKVQIEELIGCDEKGQTFERKAGSSKSSKSSCRHYWLKRSHVVITDETQFVLAIFLATLEALNSIPLSQSLNNSEILNWYSFEDCMFFSLTCNQEFSSCQFCNQ